MPNHPLYAQLTNVDAIALKITLTANPNDNDNPNDNHNPNANANPNANDFRALKARLLRQIPQAQAEGAKASKNLNYFGLLFTV